MAHYRPNPGTCTALGCESPRAGLPSRVEGGETLCRRHRQYRRAELMRAAGLPANGRADLLAAPSGIVTLTEGPEPAPISAKPVPKPTPLADVPTVRMAEADPTDKPIPYALTEAAHETVAAATAEALSSIKPLPNTAKPWLRIYTIAPKQDVLRVRGERDKLHTIEGVAVRASWLDMVEPDSVDPLDREEAMRIRRRNFAEIASADIVIAYTNEAYGRETYAEIHQATIEKKQVFWSLERGGLSLGYQDDNIIPAPLDSDIIRTIRNLASDWRRVA